VCQAVEGRTSTQHVYRLQLADNNLDGELPANFGDLTQVEWLALDIFNKLRGPLPESIKKMTQVRAIDVLAITFG
jgi:hypothetical protein